MAHDKRDFREETNLNAAEERLLKYIADKLGVSKSAAMRLCIHIVGDDLLRKERLADTGILSEV
jgi:hypothetical protein